MVTRDLTLKILSLDLPPKSPQSWRALDLSYGSIGAIRNLLISPSPAALSTQLVPRTSLLKRINQVGGVWLGVLCATMAISMTCPHITVLSGCDQLVGMNLVCRCAQGKNLIQRNTN